MDTLVGFVITWICRLPGLGVLVQGLGAFELVILGADPRRLSLSMKPVGERLSRAIRSPPILLLFEHNHWDLSLRFFLVFAEERILLDHFLPDLVALFPVHHPRAGVETVVRHLHFDYRIGAQVQAPVRVSISAAFRTNHDVGIPGGSIHHG